MHMMFRPALFVVAGICSAQSIDRKAVVSRHNIRRTAINAEDVLSVGNGAFAFNTDITSSQSLNSSYNLFDLNTLTDWAFHSIPFDPTNDLDGLNMFNYTTYESAGGKTVRYPTVANVSAPVAAWTHDNPHRLNVVQVSLRLGSDGTGSEPLTPLSVLAAEQELDLWRGTVSSNLTIQFPSGGSTLVNVTTVAHPVLDALAMRVGMGTGALGVRLAFPYAIGAFGPSPSEWSSQYDSAHRTHVTGNGTGWARVTRGLDRDGYEVALQWSAVQGGEWLLVRTGPHTLDLIPPPGSAPAVLELTFLVTPIALAYPVGADMQWIQDKIAATAAAVGVPNGLPGVQVTLDASAAFWSSYWEGGAFVDLATLTQDPTAYELERRVILSQYLLRVNSAGAAPPQETGLLCNSWSGKHHMEMRWWHTAHWPLWGRPDLMHRQDGWFAQYLPNATSVAAAQGYKGARWPKMIAAVSNTSGIDVPWVGLEHAPFPLNNGSADGYGNLMAWESGSGVGPLLVWQQPHTVWYAEAQRAVAAASGNASAEATVLSFHAPLVFATADFLASFPYYNATAGRYWLGPPLFGAEESGNPATIFNPSWELVSFKWALGIASSWRTRLGLPAVPEWDMVRGGLADPALDPLPPGGEPAYGFNQFCGGAYVSGSHAAPASSCVPCTSHPSPTALYGASNGAAVGVDAGIANNTVKAVLGCWLFGNATEGTNVWGWDFPLIALSQSRLSWDPTAVVSTLLMDVLKNSYMVNGVNYQTQGLPAYMPGNGGLLLAVAGMAAGFAGPDGSGSSGGGFPVGWGARAEGFPIPML